MKSDDCPVGRILSRRQTIALVTRNCAGLLFGAGLLGLGEAAGEQKSNPEIGLVACPALTEGPFFVDERLNRGDLLQGTSRPSVLEGMPLGLHLKVLLLGKSGLSPLKGAFVDIWHTDATGVYSDESNPMNHEDTSKQKWLRGYQATDSKGSARFKTIIPGWYPGRTTHVHFKVRVKEHGHHQEFTSQLFFDDRLADFIFQHPPYLPRGSQEVRNDSDDIYGQSQPDGTSAGESLTLNLMKNPAGKGYQAHFVIVLSSRSLAQESDF